MCWETVTHTYSQVKHTTLVLLSWNSSTLCIHISPSHLTMTTCRPIYHKYSTEKHRSRYNPSPLPSVKNLASNIAACQHSFTLHSFSLHYLKVRNPHQLPIYTRCHICGCNLQFDKNVITTRHDGFTVVHKTA